MTETTELFSCINADVLNALARQLGVPKHITRKPDLIAELDLFVRERLRELVGILSDIEKKLLAEAAHNGGYVDPVRFTAKYGVACPLPKAYPRSDISPMLLLVGGEYGSRQVPAQIAKQLRTILAKPAAVNVTITENLPLVYVPDKENWQRTVHVHQSERIALAELRCVLRLVQAGKLKLTDKGGRPTGDAVRLITGVLVASDFLVEPPPEETDPYTEPGGAIRAHAWGVLVQQCGWAKAKGGRLGLTKDGQTLLVSRELSELRAGINRFLADDDFDEFNRINHIRGQSGRGKRYLTAPGKRKQSIRGAIAEWPVGEWISFDEAVRFMNATGHHFKVSHEDYTLYTGEAQYGYLSGASSGINRQYLRAFLFESLGTLGLIDVAYVYPHDLWPELGDAWGTDDLSFCSRYDGLLYVRLNALGAYCLGVTDTYQAPPAPVQRSMRVLPNREIALIDQSHFSAADRHVLAMFATEKSEYVWELDPARILSHIESGGKVEDALEFLRSQCDDQIPETVQVMLRDLASRSNVVRRVQDALLVELADETSAALIAHDRQAGKLCQLAGGRHVVVPKQSSRAFRSAIKKLGYIIPDDRWPA
jgi:hypothetical protein